MILIVVVVLVVVAMVVVGMVVMVVVVVVVLCLPSSGDRWHELLSAIPPKPPAYSSLPSPVTQQLQEKMLLGGDEGKFMIRT